MSTRVLFVCIHNSARSQMAEAFLSRYGNGNFCAESAGLEPGVINPIVVDVMKEEGINLSQKTTQSVFDLARQNKKFDYIVAVCDKEAAQRCPIVPGKGVRLHWPFADPSAAKGSYEEKLSQVREIRDEIKEKVKSFVSACNDHEGF